MSRDVADEGAYVPLVEAAEFANATTEDLRKALKRNELRAVRENPANKRSRWLVALEDVESLFGGSPEDEVHSPEDADSDVDVIEPESDSAADEWTGRTMPVDVSGDAHADVTIDLAASSALTSVEERMDVIESELTAASEHLRQTLESVSDQEARSLGTDRRLENLEQRLVTLAESVDAALNRIESNVAEQLDESTTLAARSKDQLADLDARIAELEANERELTKQLDVMRAERERLSMALRGALDELGRAGSTSGFTPSVGGESPMWRRRRTGARRSFPEDDDPGGSA